MWLEDGSVTGQPAVTAMMLYICALIIEHCNIDELAMNDPGSSHPTVWNRD